MVAERATARRGEGAAGTAAIAMWRIENDPRAPGRLVMRNEGGDACFESLDGGRSWQRAGGGPGEFRAAG